MKNLVTIKGGVSSTYFGQTSMWVLALVFIFGCADDNGTRGGSSPPQDDSSPGTMTGGENTQNIPLNQPSPASLIDEMSVDISPLAATPLYQQQRWITTRGYFHAGDILVNEFTAGCGGDCPDGLSDGDVGLDSWRVVLDSSGKLAGVEALDRIVLGNIYDDAFDSIVEESPALIFRDGVILRNSAVTSPRAFEEGPRGVHLIEFDADSGLFGNVSDGITESASILEPLYLKGQEVAPPPDPLLGSFPDYVTQPLIQSIIDGPNAIGTARFVSAFASPEMGALALSGDFSEAEREYWTNHGHRLLTYFAEPGSPVLLYNSHTADTPTTWSEISGRLAQHVVSDNPGAFWIDRPAKAHRKRQHLLHTIAPITGQWKDYPTAIVVDQSTQELQLQSFTSTRETAVSTYFDNVLTSNLLSSELSDMNVQQFTEYSVTQIDAHRHVVEPISTMVNSVLDTDIDNILADALDETVVDRSSFVVMSDWLIQRFVTGVHHRLAAHSSSTAREFQRALAVQLIGLLLQGDDYSKTALIERVESGLAQEVAELSENEERERLARRVIRPFSDFNDEMLRPLGEFIDDLVDDPVTETMGEIVGTANQVMNLIPMVTNGLIPAPSCGFLPENASEFARGVFGVDGANLDESNMVFIEALKLVEFESNLNYSFERRLSDLLSSARQLDERLASVLVDVLMEVLTTTQQKGSDFSIVDDYASRLDFNALIESLAGQWLTRMIDLNAPDLKSVTVADLSQAVEHSDPLTFRDILSNHHDINHLLGVSIAGSMSAMWDESDAGELLLRKLLKARPLIVDGVHRGISIKRLITRRVSLHPAYIREISSFLETELAPYLAGWTLNAGIDLALSDALKADRGDCLSQWVVTLDLYYATLVPGSPAAETVLSVRNGLRTMADHFRRLLFVSAVGPIIEPVLSHHRAEMKSFVLDLQESPIQRMDLSELFEGEVVWAEGHFASDQLILIARIDRDDRSFLQLAVIAGNGDVRQFDLGEIPQGFVGGVVDGNTVLFARRKGLKTSVESLCLISGRVTPRLTYDSGLLTHWTRWNSSRVSVLRLRDEPFDGPITTHHEGGQVFHNGLERTQGGMLYLLSPQ